MTDTELARIIELSQKAWANGEPAGEDGLPVGPGLEVSNFYLQGGYQIRRDKNDYVAKAKTLETAHAFASAPTWTRQLIAEIYALRGILGDVMRDGGISAADPLPPEQSMREILRLREAIRKALAIIRPSMPHVVETQLILREALGEDDE